MKTLLEPKRFFDEVPNLKTGPWSLDIAEMEQFFQSVKLPEVPICLDKCSRIINIELFIKTHLSIVRGQNGNERYKPYLDRLIQLKRVLNK